MRARGPSLPACLLLFTIILQASVASDIYWEGEDDAEHEFLEVKEDDTNIGSHLDRVKRAFEWITDPFSMFQSTTTEAPSNLEERVDEELLDDKDEDQDLEGSGQSSFEPEAKEKTLRVSFVVMEPYQKEYSNRDSSEFQEFSKSLAANVDKLFEELPGTQRASLVRIQSRPSEELSCKVTLDIVTTGFENTDKITEVLYEHIRDRRRLGDVTVSDSDFSALNVDPDAVQPIDACAISELRCEDGQCVLGSARCNGVNDCNDGSDEAGCPSTDIDTDQRVDFQSPEESTNASLPFPSETDEACEEYFTCYGEDRQICRTKVCDGHKDCLDGDDEDNCGNGVCTIGEFSCDETRCVELSRRCDGHDDCHDGRDEADCPKSCGVDDFRCNDGKCIEGSRRCDKVVDCSNQEDEYGCECSQEEFKCVSDGSCIEMRKRCDDISDCKDNSDETDCEVFWTGHYVCQDPGKFKCRDGTCISILLRCDGFRDCTKDGSDEINCPCKADQWQCDQGSCIKRTKRCDGRVDCPTDRSDERNCHAQGYFRCRTGKLIPEYMRCNREYNCPQGDFSDEKNCPCGVGDFKCDNGYCIPADKKCDGTHDCQDRSDERNCKNVPVCMANQYKCPSGECVPAEAYCNGTAECPDGSDERNCPCRDGFVCRDHTCLNIALRCNGHNDCPAGEDEHNCDDKPPSCPERTIPCQSFNLTEICATVCDRNVECQDNEDESDCEACDFPCDLDKCLPKSAVCDDIKDCNDGTDEMDCIEPCDGENDFRCANNQCINSNLRCNMEPNCDDGSDELDCGISVTSRPGCQPNQFTCHDGSCINSVFTCDRHPDCNDNSDEINCEYNHCQFRCGSGDIICVGNSSVCDNKQDCDDNSDELDCPWYVMKGPRFQAQECHESQFTCYNGVCIPHIRRCDNIYDCSDFSDEQNCQNSACNPQDNFLCRSGECLPLSVRCNMLQDCTDYSDEENCNHPSTMAPIPTTTYRPATTISYQTPLPNRPPYRPDQTTYRPAPTTYRSAPPTYRPNPTTWSPWTESNYNHNSRYPTDSPVCGRGQWRCENGPCIELHQRCDGNLDCPQDDSDEFDCPTGTIPAISLQVLPEEEHVRYGGDVVLRCRDVGPTRAAVRWIREGGRPLKAGAVDRNGRLEIFQVTMSDAGTYICDAPGFPQSQKRVVVSVSERIETAERHFCSPYEATCGNMQCIPKSAICNRKIDCADGSDEDSCSISSPGTPDGICQPNQFLCKNRKCVLLTFKCDSDDDCGDGSDEADCGYAPEGQCRTTEFSCASNNQCIPKSFHCDSTTDCIDGSDEIGCAPVYVTKPPRPANQVLSAGDTLTLVCEAVGVPTPLVTWRLNWGRVPEKCRQHSNRGIGELTCPDMQPEDSGAYSCEAINNKVTVFAVPDALVTVNRTSVCRAGYFNSEARTEADCIQCFCFGTSKSCHSADLFTYNMPTPLGEGGTRLVGIAVDARGDVRIDNEPITSRYYFQPLRNGATVTKLQTFAKSNAHPYLTLPETYNGNQLTSYGGHIKYQVSPHSQRYGYNQNLPHIIIKGKYETLFHYARRDNARTMKIEARITPEYWQKAGPVPATRENIMMALDNIEMILLRADLNDAGVNITNFVMESAQSLNAGLGAANLVEQCTCLEGYSGYSCEKCASGYVRQMSGPWLGGCVAEAKPCPAGYYGDSNSGCLPCPCPLTNRENQFARTCSLGPSGQVICDCETGYVGNSCERCAHGYTGNPLIPGDSCRVDRGDRCDPAGTADVRLPDECRCKDNVQGRYCNQCKEDSFFLSRDFKQGCALCFCTGLTQQCTSGNLRRKTTTVQFNVPQIVEQVRVYQSAPTGPVKSVSYKAPKETDLRPELTRGEMTLYNVQSQPMIYYWSLPSSFAGDKVTSYGGQLSYLLSHVPIVGQSYRNNAADIQLISDNQITLHYFGDFEPSNDGFINATVQMLEKGWLRPDGKEVPREHFLLALADVKTILIKATYRPNSQLASLVSASIETADVSGDGPQALHVEECVCPTGYKGTSCEDCAAGYKRSDGDGLYLKHCEPCTCNGHSSMCNPEDGKCIDCQDNTSGFYCEECLPGFERDAYQNCVPSSKPANCTCDPAGTLSCSRSGQCLCRQNVEGDRCERCRPGTFGLDANNDLGCLPCYCSGVTSQCHEANYYSRIPMPAPILGENYGGYAIMDLNAEDVIHEHFVPAANESELMYVFDYPPVQDLYWSLPVFPGNRVLSYGGSLSLTQSFNNQSPGSESQPGIDVVLVGDGLSLYWSNFRPIRSGEPLTYQVPLREESWQLLNSGSPATRNDLMAVLRNLKRVLVRATLSDELIKTAIADVSMDTAAQVPGAPATGIEVCMCPEGFSGTSCEDCTPGFYKDERGSCRQCNCNGQNCELRSNGQVTCLCRPPYTGPDCRAIASESENEITTRPLPSRPTVTVTITSPTIKIQEVGSSVNFTCQAQSIMTRGRLPVTWVKDSGYLPQGRSIVDQRTGMLVITQLRVSDSGVYICQTSDGISTAQDSATLKVPGNEMTAPSVTVVPSMKEYHEGQRIELFCNATGSPKPQISWSRASGKPLPLNAETNEAYFVIEGARQEDSGEYRCIATNNAGSVDRIAVVRVNPRISYPSRDRLSVSPSNYNVGEGESTRVVCTGTTNVPAGSIGWIRQDGEELSTNVRSDNGVLYIDVARLENQGVYLCQTANQEVAPVAVTVLVAPLYTPPPSDVSSISVDNIDLTIPTNGTRTVDCIPSGYPQPQIRWSKYEGEFSKGTSQRGNTLIISNAQEHDRGYYICEGIVDNQAIKNIYVMVNIEKREAPKVEIWPPGENAPLGGQFEFHCRVLAGIPEPDVTWSRSGGRPLSPHAQILPQNILRFENVEVNDEGEYTCAARNNAGMETASAVLKVRSPPEIILTPTNYVQVVIGEPVTVECRASGYPEPYVSITSNYRELVPASPGIAVLRIPSASEGDDGDYICNATSVAGNIWEQFSIRVDRGDGGFGDDGSGEDEFNPDETDFSFNKQPSNLMSSVGEVARISCNVTNDRYEVRWSRLYRQPLQKNAYQSGIELIINNVSKSDSGRYECLLINRNTNEVEQSAYTSLTVIARPRITLRPQTQTVNPGQSPTVECIVEGDDILEVVWLPVNRPFSNRVESRRSTLIFHKIEIEDAGEYKCFARNRRSNASSVAEVLVSANNDRATSESHENEQYGHVGAAVHLSCNTSRNERIWWSKDGKPVQRPAVKKPDGSLFIKFAQKSDSGYYVCSIRDQYGGQTSNYINLHIDERGECQASEYRCNDGYGCIVEDLLCDGVSDCADHSDEENCLSRDKRYPVTLWDDEPYILYGPRDDASLSLVAIEQPRRAFIEKETVQVDCKARVRGAKISWERYGTQQYVESRVYGDGALLIIPGVEKSDAGEYRCVGRDKYDRQSYDYFTLVVEPGSDAPSYSPSEGNQVFTARLGQSVDMPCYHDMEPPVNFEWRKEHTGMPQNVRTNDALLHVDGVTETDAGTYVCRVSNPQRSIETRAILRVEGIVPMFDGEGYISLPTLKDAYVESDIQIALKPTDPNGLVLFNGQNENGSGDFLALQLVDGVPEFVVETGSSRVVVRGDRPLQLNVWHTIRLTRNQVKVTMDVDDNGPFSTEPKGSWQILELKQPLYVGGVRSSDQLPQQLQTARGFVGCVSMLVLGKEEQNLMVDNIDKYNVNECKPCYPNLCRNDGVCQEARNEQGYSCICRSGFAGLNCDRTGEACRPGLCGPGKCSDTNDGYKCACPVTHTGRNCEIQQSIEYPAFTGSAYLAIKTPRSSKTLRMSMKVKATAPVTDGIIMYCAETARGHGGFTSLAVREGRLEFRYDLGDGYGPAVVRLERPLQANEWTEVHISRMGPIVTLKVNAQDRVEGRLRSESSSRSLYLETPMFVGGIDDSIILNNGTIVTGGFSGCVKDVMVYGDHVNIVSSSIQSANVQECTNYDRGDIPDETCSQCRNGGYCGPDATSCTCPPEYTGQYCETRAPSPFTRRARLLDPCVARPCRNGGSCRLDRNSQMNYTCDCSLGFAGANCQMPLSLNYSVGFNGNGYLELPAHLLFYGNLRSEPVIIAFLLHTTEDGVLLYQKEALSAPGVGDFILIRVDRGVVVVDWNFGSGVSTVSVDNVFVTDGEIHKIIVKITEDNFVTLSVGESENVGGTVGLSNTMNADSNIYIGGIPNALNVYNYPGLKGCFVQVEMMGVRGALNFGSIAVTARNTQRCKVGIFPNVYPYFDDIEVFESPPPEFTNHADTGSFPIHLLAFTVFPSCVLFFN